MRNERLRIGFLRGAREALTDRAVLCGALDGSIVIPFMVVSNFLSSSGANQLLWYIFTLASKLLLIWLFRRQRSSFTGTARLFLVAVTVMVGATMLAGVQFFPPYLAAAGFLVHICLTLSLVGNRLKPYLAVIAALVGLSAGVHALECLMHKAPQAWGRYYYFGGTQPNLGGEIEAAAALAAVIAYGRAPALVLLGVMLADSYYLQARSAELVILLGAAVAVAHDAHRRLSTRRALGVAIAALIGAALIGEIGAATANVADTLFMVNDRYRGIGSGASGRLDVWNTSIDLFTQSPLFGHGLDYFPSIGFIGSHNLVLFGLAQFGLLSLLFFTAIILSYRKLLREDPYRFWVLMAALPLFLFNDRLINLNPYPFIVYVMLLAPTKPMRRRRPLASPAGEKPSPLVHRPALASSGRAT